MTTRNQILRDLRQTFGKVSVLYPEQLAQILGSNHAVVKNLSKGFQLPLTIKAVGNRHAVTIHSVADWLSESDIKAESKRQVASARLQAPARKRASIGRTLLALKTQRSFIDELIAHLIKSLDDLDSKSAASENQVKVITIKEPSFERPIKLRKLKESQT